MIHPVSSSVSPVPFASSNVRSVVSIQCEGQELDLYAERAVHWKHANTLLIADPHFGKGASFRASGVPVPAGTTHANLVRLSVLLERTAARRLIVLGDLLHSSHGRAPDTLHAIGHWRTLHPHVEIMLVRGNHDVHAGDPPTEWNITCVNEPFIAEPFAYRHTPDAACGEADVVAAHRFTLAGHVHPCAMLRDVDGSSLRVPCFHLSGRQMILPAFGAFTGGHAIHAVEGDRVFAVWQGTISAIPTIAGA